MALWSNPLVLRVVGFRGRRKTRALTKQVLTLAAPPSDPRTPIQRDPQHWALNGPASQDTWWKNLGFLQLVSFQNRQERKGEPPSFRLSLFRIRKLIHYYGILSILSILIGGPYRLFRMRGKLGGGWPVPSNPSICFLRKKQNKKQNSAALKIFPR